MIEIPVEDCLRRLHARRRRAAADHRPRRRHPRRRPRRPPLGFDIGGVSLMPLAARVRLDVRRRRAVRDPGPRRPRRPGGDRRDVGRAWSGSASPTCSSRSCAASEGAEPFSTGDLVGRRRVRRPSASRPGGSAASSSRPRARRTSSAPPPAHRHPGRDAPCRVDRAPPAPGLIVGRRSQAIERPRAGGRHVGRREGPIAVLTS